MAAGSPSHFPTRTSGRHRYKDSRRPSGGRGLRHSTCRGCPSQKLVTPGATRDSATAGLCPRPAERALPSMLSDRLDGAFYLDDLDLCLSRPAPASLPNSPLYATEDPRPAAPADRLSAGRDQTTHQTLRPPLLGLALQGLVGLAAGTGLRATSNRHCLATEKVQRALDQTEPQAETRSLSE